MRVVTGEAADAPIIGGKTPAVLKSVGLEANIDRSLPVVAHDCVPGAMALAAEVGRLLGVHELELGRNGSEVVFGGIGHVLDCADVTALALDAGAKRIEGEFGAVGGAGGVAVEALESFPGGGSAAHGLKDGVRGEVLVAGGGGESIFAREIADHALVKKAILLEDPGLRVLAEHPADGKGERVFAVGDGVGALAVFGFDCVGVAIFDDGEIGMGVEDRIGARVLKRVVHGSVDVRRGYANVTCGAGGRRCG